MEYNIENPYIQYMYSYPHKTAYRSLKNTDFGDSGINLADVINRLEGQENSLYIHIPFCQYKCGYCNLFSVVGQNIERMEQYVEVMEKQASQLAGIIPEHISFADLTIGGGTPLILPEKFLSRVFDIARKYFSFEYGKRPVVVETSPNQTTEEKLRLLKSYGVTRVSIGVQSFHEKELEMLCRYHTPQAARAAIEAIKHIGFPCMNIDIIYGIPEQTESSLLASLKQAIQYEPDELFVYPLYVKEGTTLYKKGIKRGDNAANLYQCATAYLKENGYLQQSMRRFVRQKKTRLEPKNLCGFGNTLSIGCGGRSYLGNLHFCTPYAVGQEQCNQRLRTYMEQEDFLTITHGYILSEDEQKRRYAVKHILFGKGIDKADYRAHFGEEVQRDFPMIDSWCQKGYAIVNDTHVTLTESGIALSDYLGAQFISAEVAEKMEVWKRRYRDGSGN